MEIDDSKKCFKRLAKLATHLGRTESAAQSETYARMLSIV